MGRHRPESSLIGRGIPAPGAAYKIAAQKLAKSRQQLDRYTNDLQGFSAYCRSWGANADEFIGGEGACAAQGLQCTTAQSTDGRSFGCAPACPAPMFYP